MAASPTHPPIVAPTMAPVEGSLDVEAEELELETPDACDACDDDEEPDSDDEALESFSEEEEERVAVGEAQPRLVGEVRANPSMGWANACATFVLWLKTPLSVLPSSSNLITGTLVLTGRLL